MTTKPLFEIKTVKHISESIAFTWNDTGGFYNVYKDGEHVYEGTVPEFIDGEVIHGEMVTYTIERVENGDVVEVITLQTTAFSPNKNNENPLESIVMTTIVAKTQIALSWEYLKDVDRYDIYRNGIFMRTVKMNRYIDRDFSIDETYTYSVLTKRPFVQSEEHFNVSKSMISKMMNLLNPFSSKKEVEFEEFTMIKMISPTRELLLPLRERCKNPLVDTWKLRYTTFLADEWIVNPNLLSPNHYFKGDGRAFDVDGESYRTRVDIQLAYHLDGSPLTFKKHVGPSIAYNYFNQFRQKETASYDGISLKRLDHDKEVTGFLLTHSVGNPLTSAPAIDYEVQAVLRRNGVFDMTGFHDQAPHHEIYLKRGEEKEEWFPIYQAESKGLAWLAPVTPLKYWRISNFQ